MRSSPPAFWGIVFFVFGIFLIFWLQSTPVARQVDLSGFKAGDATVVFAIAFLFAAALERIVESLKRVTIGMGTKDKERVLFRPFGDIHMMKKERKSREYKKNIDEEERRYAISSWGLASLLGMLVSYFTIGILELLGIRVWIPGVLEPHPLDSIVTGMIIGSGTKPFHDLITAIEKHKENPEETGHEDEKEVDRGSRSTKG